ncbi:MAG: hypothetical protein Q4G68_09375 [Planctomycetia bacterium]|nr:hypothetical protein [Planctomycetia bacterium]
MFKRMLCACFCFVCLTSFNGYIYGEESKVIDLGNRLELFVDSYLIESFQGTAFKLHEPRDEGKVLDFNSPWDGVHCGGITVIHDGDLFRLYYRAMPTNEGDGVADITCYAESTDGIHWIKPELGICEFDGSTKNNIILSDDHSASHNFAPFLDTNPSAPAEERYKALAGLMGGLHPWASPDGIHWHRLADKALSAPEIMPDSQNVSFWSQSEGKYVCYARTWQGGVRGMVRVESPDYLNWSDHGNIMTYGDTPREQIYINQTAPYFRAPHIYLATAARFMDNKQVVSNEVCDEIQVQPSQRNACSEPVLLTTRGGSTYDRTFMEALIRPDFDPGNWTARTNYPACGIVQTSETEMSIYVNCYYAQPRSCLHRYSSRIDGFISINAPYNGGELITKPLTFTGSDLVINAQTSAAGNIQIELQDAQGNPIPGYELTNSPNLTGNWIAKKIVWNNEKQAKDLIGQPVKIRFVMKDADLYSLKFE